MCTWHWLATWYLSFRWGGWQSLPFIWYVPPWILLLNASQYNIGYKYTHVHCPLSEISKLGYVPSCNISKWKPEIIYDDSTEIHGNSGACTVHMSGMLRQVLHGVIVTFMTLSSVSQAFYNQDYAVFWLLVLYRYVQVCIRTNYYFTLKWLVIHTHVYRIITHWTNLIWLMQANVLYSWCVVLSVW